MSTERTLGDDLYDLERKLHPCGKMFETLCNLSRGHKGMCSWEPPAAPPAENVAPETKCKASIQISGVIHYCKREDIHTLHRCKKHLIGDCDVEWNGKTFDSVVAELRTDGLKSEWKPPAENVGTPPSTSTASLERLEGNRVEALIVREERGYTFLRKEVQTLREVVMRPRPTKKARKKGRRSK